MVVTAPELRINLAALASNYETFRKATKGQTGAVVKANAYGFGLAEVVHRLEDCGCRNFFVATLSEATALVPIISGSVYVLGTFSDQNYLRHISDLNAIPVLHDSTQLRMWNQISQQPCALFFNTGMNRLGLKMDQYDCEFIRSNLSVCLLMTHLACADEPEHPMNQEQLKQFEAIQKDIPDVPTSIGNSAAILNDACYQGDITRPGIGLYGGNPYVNLQNPMVVVATCTAPLIASYLVRGGETIGYGSSYKTDKDMHIGVLGIGYADGIPRRDDANLAFVLQGETYPVVGRVSMDFVTVDLSNRTSFRTGTQFEWFGENQSVDHIAKSLQTISYEIFTGLGSRVKRIYYA